ncbi:MAG: hypothetical protein V1701_02550 [Planctomycetota bacterium]
MWPFKKTRKQAISKPAVQNMEFTEFLKRHQAHNVGAITDRVVIQCFDCNEAFILSQEQWQKVQAIVSSRQMQGVAPQTPAPNPPEADVK